MNNTIGIWLQVDPRGRLVGEGIAHLTKNFILAGLNENKKFLIIAPKWSKPEVRLFLEDLSDDDKGRITIRYGPRFVPLLLRFAANQSAPRNYFWRKIEHVAQSGRTLVRRAVARASLFNLPATLIIISAILVPVLASRSLVSIARGCARCVKIVESRFSHEDKTATLRESLDLSYKQLARAAGRKKVDLWLIPSPSWSFGALLPGRKIAFFPDFVFAEHPAKFTADEIHYAERRFKHLMATGINYICFSDHVKERHLIGHFGLNPDRVKVIPHSPSNLWPTLLETVGSEEIDSNTARYVDDYLLQLSIDAAAKEREDEVSAMRSLISASSRFIFVSSQIRPYKNFYALLEGVARFNKRHPEDALSIITTATFDWHDNDPILTSLRAGEASDLMVFSLPRLPTAMVACLYRLAWCAVHASHFEGGFPFTFSEATSLGTPILLARAPYVLEGGVPAASAYLFDPESGGEAIKQALERLTEDYQSILAAQLDLLAKMSARTWEQVAQEYLDFALDNEGQS